LVNVSRNSQIDDDDNDDDDGDDDDVSMYRVAQKKGQPAILSHCKYSENSVTELHENWWTSAILYAEHSH